MSNNTSNKIAVSVIIPITTTETYLARCLDSVLAQTLHNIEVILVDTSSDVPSSLCAKYAVQDSRIKILNKRGVGYGAAFNAGLAEATGEYIAFVDSCDWLEPEMYEVLYEIASDQNIDVVHCLKYSNKDGTEPKVANAFANSSRWHVNEKTDFKFNVPMFLFYSEDLYSTIYRENFLTEHQIKFSDIPGSNAQNLGFTFLVFCHLGSFYIHEAPLYHLNPKRSYFTDKSFKIAMDSIGEYCYINSLIDERDLEDKHIGKRYLHIGMAKIFRHIRHRFFVHCKTISQKREFLNGVKPLLQNYYPLKNDNMFLNGMDKRVYKRLLRHPLKTSITYTVNSVVKRLGKSLLTEISFQSKRKHIRIFGFRFFFYKKTPDYYTFILFQLPIIRHRRYHRIEENSVITSHYFLGMLFAKDIEKKDTKGSIWSAKRKKFNPGGSSIIGADPLIINKLVSIKHGNIFSPFKNINTGSNITILGNGLISYEALSAVDGKVICCNKNINKFEKKPDYIFASEYISSNAYYSSLIQNQESYVFFDYINTNRMMLVAKRPHLESKIRHSIQYFGDWRFYEDIYQDIDNHPLAFFGDNVHSAIHFALYTNPDVIYLIGCDVYDEGIRKNNRWFAPTGQELLVGYKKLKLFRDMYYPNTKIICVNPIGLNGIFEERYTNNSFKPYQINK